jgi:parvulin-like peptidyl-prolyl isomerase
MARRDRTTGLPRPRGRTETKQKARFSFDDKQQLRALYIIGGVLIAVLVGLWGWRWYDSNYRQPSKTILAVAGEEYSLRYYSDRLFIAAQAQQSGGGTNLTILQQTILTDLENEAIAEQLAREKGLTVSEEDVTNEIAAQLGVPAGGAGSSFDTLYRQRLRALHISDGNYRRFTEAQVWVNKLSDSYSEELGDTGELITIRKVVSATKESSDAILARVKSGEDLGTVAQTDSTDLASRQKDGLDEPEPERLLPDAVRTAIKDKPQGELLGPIEVAGTFWVFEIETREPAGVFTETQKAQLADLALTDAIAAKRPQVERDLNISSGDYDWANENAGK